MPPMKLKEDKLRERPLVVAHNGLGMFKIEVQGGGHVPNVLRGLFTTEEFARVQLDKYNAGIYAA